MFLFTLFCSPHSQVACFKSRMVCCFWRWFLVYSHVRPLKFKLLFFAWNFPGMSNEHVGTVESTVCLGRWYKGKMRMPARRPLAHVPTISPMVPIPHLQTDCAPQPGEGAAVVTPPPAAVACNTVPILELSQTWMPFLQASVWYVWYIRLLFNPTIYQTYSYRVLPCLRGFLIQFIRQQETIC